ncbi:hypothetical protein AGMMS50230_15110 [Spirochaetia bacterium]|nr:hypothetical protein AGMMS50230_15110 [Spirochaetia bacterium]
MDMAAMALNSVSPLYRVSLLGTQYASQAMSEKTYASSLKSAEEAARIVKTKTTLGIQNGILITVPIPEKDELNPVFINDNIERALEQADDKGIRGKATTPFLLAELHRTTGGKSVAANKALVFNNSRTAAQIAKAYYAL